MKLEDMETGDLPLFTYDEIKTIPVEALMRLFKLKGLEEPLKPGSTRTVEVIHMLYPPEWSPEYDVEANVVAYIPVPIDETDCFIKAEDITNICDNSSKWKLTIGNGVTEFDDPTIVVHIKVVEPLTNEILREFGLFYHPRIKS